MPPHKNRIHSFVHEEEMCNCHTLCATKTDDTKKKITNKLKRFLVNSVILMQELETVGLIVYATGTIA